MTQVAANQSTSSLFSLNGQVAIVTGAGKGIGRACALTLAQAGADVALTARTQADLEKVAAEIRAMGRRAIVVAGDISQEATMDTLVAETLKTLGKITILINNAGGAGPKRDGRLGPAATHWQVLGIGTLGSMEL